MRTLLTTWSASSSTRHHGCTAKSLVHDHVAGFLSVALLASLMPICIASETVNFAAFPAFTVRVVRTPNYGYKSHACTVVRACDLGDENRKSGRLKSENGYAQKYRQTVRGIRGVSPGEEMVGYEHDRIGLPSSCTVTSARQSFLASAPRL